MSDRMKCPICGHGDAITCDCLLPNYITATNEARRWARKLYLENIELRRQLDTLIKIQDFITTEMDEYSDGQLSDDEIVKDVYARLNRAFVEIETLSRQLEVAKDALEYLSKLRDSDSILVAQTALWKIDGDR